nr:hypothetical protein [Tanacetum cinerariifolium]
EGSKLKPDSFPPETLGGNIDAYTRLIGLYVILSKSRSDAPHSCFTTPSKGSSTALAEVTLLIHASPHHLKDLQPLLKIGFKVLKGCLAQAVELGETSIKVTERIIASDFVTSLFKNIGGRSDAPHSCFTTPSKGSSTVAEMTPLIHASPHHLKDLQPLHYDEFVKWIRIAESLSRYCD